LRCDHRTTGSAVRRCEIGSFSRIFAVVFLNQPKQQQQCPIAQGFDAAWLPRLASLDTSLAACAPTRTRSCFRGRARALAPCVLHSPPPSCSVSVSRPPWPPRARVWPPPFSHLRALRSPTATATTFSLPCSISRACSPKLLASGTTPPPCRTAACHRRVWPRRHGPSLDKPWTHTGAHDSPGHSTPLHRRRRAAFDRNSKLRRPPLL